jgi:formylglycine-generating enzyme required for sulfatase activity
LLDPLGIYSDVRLSVSKTTPLYGTLTAASHQEGATFLFFIQQAPVTPPPPPPRTTTTAVGSITVSSDITGVVMIDGEATGTRIKAGGTVTVSNVSTGSTEVAVKGDDGKIVKAPQMVMVVQGQTVAAAIKAPVPNTPVNPAPNNMVRINGGTFTMGSPANEPQRNSDEAQRQITVSSFYMGKYEVTQKEYQEIMGTNPSNFKRDNLPVERVSWFDAVEYCNKRSQKEGLTPAYSISGTGDNRTVTWNKSANGYRLPTEAEWEYACRAGTTTPFSTGNNITTSQANYDGSEPYNNNAKGEYRKKTMPVGSFAPNVWGLYDMHGNVREWCWNWYEYYSSGSQTDPVGPSSGSHRVLRGGSWLDDGWRVRSANRIFITPSGRGNYGFRLVRS